MKTLRVLLAASPSADRADAWALFDADGACLRTGVDRPGNWPAADSLEIVVAAAQLRIACVTLPPVPPSRVASAAGFALEDQLAGPAAALELAASRQAPDGRVRVVIVARPLLAGIAGSRRDIARIVAEPDLALPLAGWRWCGGGNGGFVRFPDGSAFAVDAPSGDGALPPGLALALTQAARETRAPAQVRVDADCTDSDLARWQRETGVDFVRGAPWRWHAAPSAAFADAIDLLPRVPTGESTVSERQRWRLFAPAAWLAGAAIALHVAATVGEWASLRVDAWREAREWTTLAEAAGVNADAAATPAAARAAIARRYAELRHAQGLPAPDDALPLLARAAPVLATLPPGSVKSAAYGDGHWTLDVARADAAVVADLDLRMRTAGLPLLIAPAGGGARLRFGER